MLRKDLVKKRSSIVQAGSASTLGNSAMELLIVEIVVMKTSAGTYFTKKNKSLCKPFTIIIHPEMYQSF